MRHRCSNKLFSRTSNQRKALFRGLMVSLLTHERIETTIAKAKEIKRLSEKIVTLGKKGDLHSRRLAFSYVPNKNVIKKLFDDIAPRFSDRNGGYLRIIKTRSRLKDNAPLAVLEFIDYEEKNIPEKKGPAEKKETLSKEKPAPKKKAAPKKEAPSKKKTTSEKKPAAKKKAAPKKKAASQKEASSEKKPATKKKATTKKKTASKKEESS